MTTFDPHGKLSTSWNRPLMPDQSSVSRANANGAAGTGEMRTSSGAISVVAESPIPEEVGAIGQSLNRAWGPGTAERFAKAVQDAQLPADQVRAAAQDVGNVLAGVHFAKASRVPLPPHAPDSLPSGNQ
jgi:hypothetical protein